ncbi:MAG: hypothetical protein VX417_05180 [SAR324 cluster bacterium]|nr:hypothetical protein [SAR324 cluster bacterium]
MSVPKKEQETGDPNELKRTARTTNNAVVGATRPALIVPAGGAACLGAARRPPKFNKFRGSEEPDGSPLDYPLLEATVAHKGEGTRKPLDLNPVAPCRRARVRKTEGCYKIAAECCPDQCGRCQKV